MNRHIAVLSAAFFIGLAGFKPVQNGSGININQTPAKGFYSTRPAKIWEESLVTGNGTMGAMVRGNVYHEIITLNQAQLFLPFHQPLVPPSQGRHLQEVRDLLSAGKYQEASQFIVDLSHTEGFGAKNSSDPYIPAFQLELVTDSATIQQYRRTTNFENGEVAVKWKDKNGTFCRKTFVSRADNLIVMSITSNEHNAISATLNLSRVLTADQERIKKLKIGPDLGIDHILTKSTPERLSFRAWYAKTWEGNFKGYEGVLKVDHKGGTVKVDGDKLIVDHANEITIIGRIKPNVDMNTPMVDAISRELNAYKLNYDQLLERHTLIHKKLFDRVSLNLNATAADRQRSSEELLKLGGENPALIEKIFNAARYNILCSTGMAPPKLQGVWGATMTPPWASDYTTNGNLPVAVSHYFQANTPELMLPLFDKLESMMGDFRTNARVLYNCRGIHIPSHIATRGYDNEFDATWPMTFWTAGAPWYATFYYDYYLYTLDKKFLRNRALPFMEEAEVFYEDFLKEGPDGKYIFSPSYSPENSPANSKSQACINATMDIMAAKALFRAIIHSSQILGVNQTRIPKWEAMLKKMPEYAVNSDGELREWLWDNLQDNDNHRHASHLFGVYDLHDPEIMGDPRLIEGVKKTIDKRMDFRRKENNGVMAFGLIHLGFAATAVGDNKTAYEILKLLGDQYWNNNMVSTHNPHEIFNVDISGGYPSLVMKMLAYSDLGKITLLPSLPADWKTGSIKGMALRGGIIINDLTWGSNNSCRVTLTSKISQTVNLKVKDRDKGKVRLLAGKPKTVLIANI